MVEVLVQTMRYSFLGAFVSHSRNVVYRDWAVFQECRLCSEEMAVVSRGNFYRLTGNPEGERLTGRDFNGTFKGFLGKGIQSQI